MSEKIYNLRAGYYDNYTGICICSDTDENLTTNEVVDLLNEQDDKIKQLEKELLEINKHLNDNEFEFTVTENRVELFKDELYIKDAHTRVEMIKGRMLKITVYPPRHAPMTFCYHITGKTFFH